MKTIHTIIGSILFILIFIVVAEADWTGFTFVNQELDSLQNARDNDCPWSIVCDKFGNSHMVWEDKRTRPLQVYYCKRNANGTWENDMKASYELYQQSTDAFGHPTLCLYYVGDTTKIMIAYIDEHGIGNGNEELRGNTFDGSEWGNSYYISNPDGFLVPWVGSNGGFWSTNMVVGADNYKYAFWQYDNGTNLKRLYFNKCLNSWTPSDEAVAYTDTDTIHKSKHVNVCALPDSSICMVYADSNPPNPYEVYYLRKTSGASNFGNYPGTQVSSPNDSSNIHAEFPSCAYSIYKNTRYLHVVWSLNPAGRIKYRSLNLSTGSWSSITEISPSGEETTRPSLACDSYGCVHVVWQRYIYANTYTTKYRKYDSITDQWSSTITIPAPDSIQRYGLPVLACDPFNNLHLLMTGRRNNQETEDVFYIFNNAPPLRPDNLHQVFGYSYVHLYWSKNKEPDVHHYRITRKYKNNTQTYDNITDTAWVDTSVPEYDLESENFVYYWLYAIDSASQGSPSSETLAVYVNKNFTLPKQLTDGELPAKIELSANSPNPFNASTEIKYSLPFEHHVSITIFDILGRKIRTLGNENQQPGYKSVIWDGRNDNGEPVSSGIYLYRLAIADMVITRQMTLLK